MKIFLGICIVLAILIVIAAFSGMCISVKAINELYD